MQLIISLEEVKKIVGDHLRNSGLNIDPKNVGIVTETHGRFDDAVTEMTGISFELLVTEKSVRKVGKA
jgi:hypothetical protein